MNVLEDRAQQDVINLQLSDEDQEYDSDDDCVPELTGPVPMLPPPSPREMAPLEAAEAARNGGKRKASGFRNPPRKKKNEELYSHFRIVSLNGGGISVECTHCERFNKPFLQTFNATKSREHLMNGCPGITPQDRLDLYRGSQTARREQDLFPLLAGPSETLEDMRINALSQRPNGTSISPVDLTKNSPANELTSLVSPVSTVTMSSTMSLASLSARSSAVTPVLKTPVRTPVRQPRIDSLRMLGPGMTTQVANGIITTEVKAMLVRGEPLVRMCDPYVRAAMLTSNPAIGMFLPRDHSTIYNKFVLPIDMSASNELDAFMTKLPGLVNIAMDGATINGCSKV